MRGGARVVSRNEKDLSLSSRRRCVREGEGGGVGVAGRLAGNDALLKVSLGEYGKQKRIEWKLFSTWLFLLYFFRGFF